MRSKSNYVNRAYKIHDKIYDIQDPVNDKGKTKTRRDLGTFKPDKSWHKGLNKQMITFDGRMKMAGAFVDQPIDECGTLGKSYAVPF